MEDNREAGLAGGPAEGRVEAMAEEVIRDIPLRDIREDGVNVRHTDVEKDIEELANSIRQHGLLQPIVLRGEYGQKPYELIMGRRRLLAPQAPGEEDHWGHIRRPPHRCASGDSLSCREHAPCAAESRGRGSGGHRTLQATR